jgi:cytochrome c-type biogenesis protein CcmE
VISQHDAGKAHAQHGRPSTASLKLLLAGGALVLGVAYLVTTALQTSAVYYLTVGEIAAKGPAIYGQQVRLAGDVTPGSVAREEAGLEIRFLVRDGSGQIPVYYRGGPVPDIFGEEVQVVVEGKLGPDGTFVASTLLAKCPSKFETEASASQLDGAELAPGGESGARLGA